VGEEPTSSPNGHSLSPQFPQTKSLGQ
jgi:hypothetical protein